ncbi:MAG: hypothetical protein AB1644_10690 [Candidatus Zixiibacteriota bacterium]
MAATPSQHRVGFSIDVSCPGCGGELELQSNFFVLTCPHCASVLRIIMPETPPAYLVRAKKPKSEVRFVVDRYCRDNGLPLTNSGLSITAVLCPYWKIDAVMLKVRTITYEVECENEDEFSDTEPEERTRTDINLVPYSTTIIACGSDPAIPYSLGMRTEFLHMIPFSRESLPDGFVSLPITQTWSDALARSEKTVSSLGRLEEVKPGGHATRLFRPRGSMVYFPYYLVESPSTGTVRRFAVDAVTGKVAGEGQDESDRPSQSPVDTVVEFGSLSVMLHRCGNCGVDLPETRSCVYACHNCDRVEFLESNGLLNRELVAATNAKPANDRLFPFWAFRLTDTSAADVRSVLGGLYPSDQLVIPAFAMRSFEGMYRLTKRVTTASGRLPVETMDRLEKSCEPATIGLTEALTLAEVVIQRDLTSKQTRLASAPVGIAPVEARLLYVPFSAENYFFVDTILHAITFEQGALGNAKKGTSSPRSLSQQ